MPIRTKMLIFIMVPIATICVLFSIVIYNTQREALLRGVDQKLETAARMGKGILPRDYHDRIQGPDSVSAADFLYIVDKFNRLCLDLGLQYIWSVLKVGDKIHFTTATSPGKDAVDADHATFFEVHRDPAAFTEVFSKMEPVVREFHNEWGHGRMILLPYYDKHGRPYCFGASMGLEKVHELLHETVVNVLIISGLSLMVGVLISYLFARTLSKPIMELAGFAEDISSGRSDKTIQLTGSTELASLGRSINTMNEAIKEKMKALQESEERFRFLSEGTFEAIVIYDNGTILEANDQFYKMFGFTKEELAAKDALSLTVSRESLDTIKSRIAKADLEPYEVMGRKKDGTEFPIEIRVRIIEYEDQKRRMAAIRDLSERKHLEAQLQQAQKMEAIGILAGGIAHDLNNILSGLVSYPDLLLMDLPHDSPAREAVLTIKDSGKKAADIVQDMLTLARRGVTVSEVINLNDIVSDYLASPEHERLKRSVHNARFETDLEKDLLNIVGSPVQLSKTIMNLVSNAAESLPGGGVVRISTRNKYLDKKIKGFEEVEEGDYAVLTVADDGVGIAAGDLKRVFEPFYTKKVMGRSGTGLGMAVVWGTVKDNKGYIDIESMEGQGSRFTLYFPATRREREQEQLTSIEEFTGRGERILVVDDVLQQREIAAVLLKRLGYAVDVVSSGEEAVEYVKEQSVDLLILDMIMDPGMDGLDTYKKILAFHPKQKAIIASGFSETRRVRDAQRLGAGQYLKKPYTLEKIGLAVKAELSK